jgi:hypothetical protein
MELMLYTELMSRNEAFEAGKAAQAAAGDLFPTKMFAGQKVNGRLRADIMLGNQPSGATSATVEGVPGFSSTVRVYKGKKNIGVLESGDKIDHVQTHSDYQRKGVATNMLRIANFAAGRIGASNPIEHGDVRTPSGDAWAKKVGGKTPQRIPSFGMQGNKLEDIK